MDPELDQDGAIPVTGAVMGPRAAGALLCSGDVAAQTHMLRYDPQSIPEGARGMANGQN